MRNTGRLFLLLSLGFILAAIWTPAYLWQGLASAAVLFFAGAAILGQLTREGQP